MRDLLKYIIVIGHLTNAFCEENKETIECMSSILTQFTTKDRSEDDEHLRLMIATYGRDNLERALACLSNMYKKII